MTKDAQGINECVEDDTINAKKRLKLWHKIPIIGVTIILFVFAAVALFGGLFKNNESDDPTKDPSTNVSTNTNDKNDSNEDFITPTIQYGFLDYTEFSTYWFDGVFRCGTDFNAGDYYILPLFGAGAMYEVADTPDDFSWTYYRLLRKIHVTEGEYVNVAHGSIMVPSNEINVNNWTKYGVFLVGKDISAGEYKMETLTDKYQSNLYGITGISGAYQLNDGDVEGTPIDSNYLFDSQKYITLENGQYIIITNVKLTNINANFSDTTTSNDEESPDNTDTTDTSSPNNDPKESFISNGHFTFSARSFVKLFDEADKNAKGYNYTYMRMNGETSLFYELAEISGGYEKVRSAGMISFVKGSDTTLSIEEDYTENIITKINVLVEDVDDVPPILVGCMCAADPALDFTTAYNLGMDVVETAGTEDGYVHNGIKYVVAADGEYYFIIISIAGSVNSKEEATSKPSSPKEPSSDESTTSPPATAQPTGCNHEWQDASCTEPKKCLYCGKTEGTATGHDWESDPWEVYCLNCDADYVTKIKFAPKNLPSVTFNREYFLYNDNYEFNVAIKSISVSDYGLMVDSNNNFTSYPNITVNFEITSSIAEGTVGNIYFDTTIYNSSGTQIATDSYTYYSGTIGEASEYSIFLEALPENDTYYLEFSITY